MTYRIASKLHNGDEIVLKKTGQIMHIVKTIVQVGKQIVEILCEDGNWYLHNEVR